MSILRVIMTIERELPLTKEEADLLFECVDFFMDDPPDHFNRDVLDSLFAKLIAF